MTCKVRRPASGELSAMLRAKADRAESNLISQVVSSRFPFLLPHSRRTRLFRWRPGNHDANISSSTKHAQNGVRRETAPGPLGGARRTLCASAKHAQNGVRRETAPDPLGGARR